MTIPNDIMIDKVPVRLLDESCNWQKDEKVEVKYQFKIVMRSWGIEDIVFILHSIGRNGEIPFRDDKKSLVVKNIDVSKYWVKEIWTVGSCFCFEKNPYSIIIEEENKILHCYLHYMGK